MELASSEYVFVLFLSFCRTTIQKVRPLGILSLCYRFLNLDLLCFGLHFCLGWFGMFSFFTSLSFPKSRFVVFWYSFLFGLAWVGPLLMLHVNVSVLFVVVLFYFTFSLFFIWALFKEIKWRDHTAMSRQ